MHAGSLQSCPTLCNPVDCSPPGPWDFPGKNTGVVCHFLLQGIFPIQGSNPGLLHCRQILYHLSHQGSPYICTSEVAQLCLTLCNPMDCSLPRSSIHGIFQARVLEWAAIAFSEGNILRISNLNGFRHLSSNVGIKMVMEQCLHNPQEKVFSI